MTYNKNCPKCGNSIEYTNKRSWYNAIKRDSKCKSCYRTEGSNTLKEKYKSGILKVVPRKKNCDLIKPFKRNCPRCNNEMSYVSLGTLNTSIKRNTMCNSCSTYKYNKTFKDVVTESHIKQMRATKAGFDSWEEYVENYPKKQFYKREVWRLTYKQPIQTLENWDKRGRCGVEGAYQLDHIKSIDWGWKNNISAQEIARWDNLRMIPWKTNLLKSNINH